MSNDWEQRLEKLTPLGAPTHLRERVLDDVMGELAAKPPARRLRWAGAAVAAGILLGIGLNLGLEKAQQARLAEIYGPEPVPQKLGELTRAVAELTDEQTASWFQRELLRAVRRRSSSSPGREIYWIDYYSRILGKEWGHEEAAEDPESHRDRRRGAGGAFPVHQRWADLDHGFAA